jgi:hypothetical protein
MVVTPPQQVYQSVHPIAAQYGVPDPIWETVAYMESSYNPNASGDQNTSFGLFQLHEGGALTTSPSSVIGTAGMPQNALEAMPRIAGAWSNLKSSFDPSSIDWWTSFAAQSGHPGGGPGNVATQNAAQAMLNDYSQSGMANYNISVPPQTSPIPNSPNTSTGSNCPWWCSIIPPSIPIVSGVACSNCGVDPSVNTVVTSISDPSWWARLGVIILGALIILIGAIKLLK